MFNMSWVLRYFNQIKEVNMLYKNVICNSTTRMFSDSPETIQEAQMMKTFTFDDVRKYAELSMDTNPIHIDINYTKNSKITRYSKPVVHGALINGLVSAVVGTKLPGPGTIVAKQTLNFPHPLYIDENVTAQVKVTKQRKSVVKCEFRCFKNDGTIVLYGDAVLIFDK